MLRGLGWAPVWALSASSPPAPGAGVLGRRPRRKRGRNPGASGVGGRFGSGRERGAAPRARAGGGLQPLASGTGFLGRTGLCPDNELAPEDQQAVTFCL